MTELKLSFPLGALAGIIVPGRESKGILGLFKCFEKSEVYISVDKIIKIGGDVILVDIRCGDNCLPSINLNAPPPPKPPKHNNCAPPCPPPCPPQQCHGIDLSSICDKNGRIDLDDY
jgi:hypothetical protein